MRDDCEAFGAGRYSRSSGRLRIETGRCRHTGGYETRYSRSSGRLRIETTPRRSTKPAEQGYSRSSGRLRIETEAGGFGAFSEAKLQPLFGAAED